MKGFRLERLKKIRVVISLIFFAATSALFLDPWDGIPAAVSNSLVSLQFIPSLVRVFTDISLTILGLLFIVGLTILFGRVYCSTLCPLGTFQDIIIHIQKKIHRRKRFEYTRPPFVFHYCLLALTGVFAVAGSMTLLNLVEPFSNYGRILTNLAEPVVILLNNGIANLFSKLDVYILNNIPLRDVSLPALLIPCAFLAVVAHIAYWHGRFFCNSLCPAGALLGLISRFAVFRIIIDRQLCNDCGACEKVCKAGCIDSATKHIDFGACIGCFNCIKSCPTDGVLYSPISSIVPGGTPAPHNPGRRAFLRNVAGPAIGLALPVVFPHDGNAAPASGYEEAKEHPVTPPGSKSIRHFSRFCTACHLCVSACPSQVLYPSFLEYGIAGMFQPRMNYDAGYCNYECTVCGRVCPTGAILPVDVGAKKLIQIGKSVFVKDDCVVVTKKKDCAACSEHCPTKAVHTVPYEGKLSVPELNNDICIGCGACEHACPTTPRKAIYVDANPVHLEAKKPTVKEQEPGFDSTKDFPF